MSPTPLAKLLREELARGPITFREFMQRALYDPAHGYYSSGRAQVGRRGDFFTNVSVGPLFGRLLARQFAEMWERLGAPREFTLVEQGAHRGDFAADALAALREQAPACFAATTCWLVEPLPALRAAQVGTLTAVPAGKIRWAPSLAELPAFAGVHFSNELPDAFPVHRIVQRADGWQERAVALDGERFVFIDAPLSSPALRAACARLPEQPAGYETEINLDAPAWLTEAAGKLERGFLLAIDYGCVRAEYYRPERTAGTLAAYAAHRREPDPLARPGEIDLTAHVDFTRLAEAARAAGCGVAGFTDQHHFMVALGERHFGENPPTAQDLRAFKTLMHPDLMGRAFHAFCIGKAVATAPALIGFQRARHSPDALLG